MGEVIKINFENKRREDLFQRYMKFVAEKNGPRVIMNSLFVAEDFKKAEKFVKDRSAQELIEQLENTDATHWNKEPALYRAIVIELRKRLNIKKEGEKAERIVS